MSSQEIIAPPFLDNPTRPIPKYNIGLAVASMKNHTTDEGYQIFQGLEYAGYSLFGHGYANNKTDVKSIVQTAVPTSLVIQDKREWEGLTADGVQKFDTRETFTNVNHLRNRPEIFKVTILKDAHSGQEYNCEAANEIGCHAWIVYYDPKKVKALSPFVREKHLIRTYHSLDSHLVPKWRIGEERKRCILSGAISGAYPLRTRLKMQRNEISGCDILTHPGYHRNGCATPKFLQTLGEYKVSICTASIYGYALRKIFESTACGCKVLTDLPESDYLPEIDGNLTRIPSNTSTPEVNRIINWMCATWDNDTQLRYARSAIAYYDYRVVGDRLARDIEKLRVGYNANESDQG